MAGDIKMEYDETISKVYCLHIKNKRLKVFLSYLFLIFTAKPPLKS